MKQSRAYEEAPTMLPLPAELDGGDFAQRVDPWLVGSTLFLLGIGIVSVYSGSALLAEQKGLPATHFLTGQLLSIGLGLLGLVMVVRIPLERWSSIAYLFLVFTFILLGVTATGLFGAPINGANRWLQLGPVSFQPAELARIAVPVYLAHSLAKKRDRVSLFSVGFLPHVVVVSLLVAFILRQPDLGTSVVVYVTLAGMLFVAGTRTAYLGLAFVGAVPVVAWYVLTHRHAWARIQVFLTGGDDRANAGWHVYQSLVTFGSGGVTGMGLGEGPQKLFFLPEPHTDFVFATIGQELGFVGVLAVIVAFAVLVGRSFRVAARQQAAFHAYLGYGIAMALGVQACINMGVATALLPAKGLTLPLVSFGKSSMLVSLVAVGILLRASAEERAQRERFDRRRR